MNRRPLWITVIGWLFIVVGSAGILKDLLPLATSNAARQPAKLKRMAGSNSGPPGGRVVSR